MSFGKVFHQNTRFEKTMNFNLVAGFPDLQSAVDYGEIKKELLGLKPPCQSVKLDHFISNN